MPYNPKKACPKHKDKYLLLGKDHPDDTGLCCHPSCFKGAVTKTSERFKSTRTMVRMVREYGYLDECVSFLVCRLLEEYYQRKAPPVLNPQWLFYNMNKFIQGDLVKGVMPQTSVPPVWKKNVDYIEITDEVMGELEEAISEENRYSYRGDLAYQDKQMLTILENVVGPVWLSFIMRDIGRQEAQKLLNLRPSQFRTEWDAKKKELQWLFRDWVETKELNLEDLPNE